MDEAQKPAVGTQRQRETLKWTSLFRFPIRNADEKADFRIDINGIIKHPIRMDRPSGRGNRPASVHNYEGGLSPPQLRDEC